MINRKYKENHMLLTLPDKSGTSNSVKLGAGGNHYVQPLENVGGIISRGWIARFIAGKLPNSTRQQGIDLSYDLEVLNPNNRESVKGQPQSFPEMTCKLYTWLFTQHF